MTDGENPDKRASPSTPTSGSGPERRRYDSPLRRRRVDETRERILAAGSALARSFPTWDWQALTVGAVAERAGVNKTTVYRHFATEQELRAAIMYRLEAETGIDYDDLELADITPLIARAFAQLPSFAARAKAPADPASPTAIADQRRREALLRAVTPATTDWSSTDRQIAAAVIDLLWSRTSHERLTDVWNLDRGQAVQAVTWAIDLILTAIRDGHPPRTGP